MNEMDEFDEFEARSLAEDAGLGKSGTEVTEVRDIEVITEEIIFYKIQAGRSFMEIGRRLNEAKAQLSHGEWLPWLKEKVDISERLAQNFMRLAKEYPKSAEIADLGASKALALLALPESEREDFAAEKHDVDGEEKTVDEMTLKELEKAIRERDEAREAADDARERAEKAEELKEDLETRLKAGDERLHTLNETMSSFEKRALDARNEADRLRKLLKEAKTQLKTLKDAPVEVAVEQPGEDVLENLRREAEEKANQQVKEIQEKLDAAENRIKEAHEREEQLAQQLDSTKKQMAASENRDVVEFGVYFSAAQEQINKMAGVLKKLQARGETETAMKLGNALKALSTAITQQ